MHFCLVDRVLERSEDRAVTVKAVSSAEEYLQDHFPGYPVLPGVMMIESMVQAARVVLDEHGTSELPWVLGGVKALKYGRFVRPGDRLRVEVTVHARGEEGVEFKGRAEVLGPGSDEPLGVGCSGRFTMRAPRGN
ncbi:MAG: 3-hydroxyacyl-ACP dehydratase FabZ family protein [Phycisphaerales bacterium JB040]